MNYEEAWSFLDRLQFFTIKLGLDSMRRFLEPLGNPHRQLPCIHIGGTNGKGSVGSTMLSILSEAGYRVGFYTSPHLSSVRERFRINDRYIGKQEFADQAGRIIDILDSRRITYFEFTTTLALLWFVEQQVDLAILEVGMGGRLDATNVVTPLISIITNVGMDHEQYLGETIEEIAFEKGGIIKPGMPVVTGSRRSAVLDVLEDLGRKNKADMRVIDRHFRGKMDNPEKRTWTYTGQDNTLAGLPLNLRGSYQVDNAALALAGLEAIQAGFPVAPEHISRGLARVKWPGRLEELHLNNDTDTHILLDGAHNPDGVRALRKTLENDFARQRLILVWAAMADKDTRRTLMAVAPLADTIIFTRPNPERSALPQDLAELLPPELRARAECIEDVEQAVNRAVGAFADGDLICVAGSLYLVGRARQLLLGELVEDA